MRLRGGGKDSVGTVYMTQNECKDYPGENCENKCIICQENYNVEETFYTCDHHFCGFCIFNWSRNPSPRGRLCPYCSEPQKPDFATLIQHYRLDILRNEQGHITPIYRQALTEIGIIVGVGGLIAYLTNQYFVTFAVGGVLIVVILDEPFLNSVIERNLINFLQYGGEGTNNNAEITFELNEDDIKNLKGNSSDILLIKDKINEKNPEIMITPEQIKNTIFIINLKIPYTKENISKVKETLKIN